MRVRHQIYSLQYMRAAAAVGVVLFHKFDQLWYFSHGVDLFFVISGFVMVATTDARYKSPASFLLDRIVRIAPMYWINIAAGSLFCAVGWKILAFDNDFGSVVKSAVFLPYYNSDGHVWPVILQGWTLNYEMFFYVLFALALLVHAWLRPAVFTLVCMSLVLAGVYIRPTSAVLSTYTNPLLMEFCAGAILGRIFGLTLDRNSATVAMGLSAATSFSLLFLSFFFERLLWGAGSVIMISFALMLERFGYVRPIRLFQFLGNASFSIYICQQIVFDIVFVVLSYIGGITNHNLVYSNFGRSFGVVSAVLVGSLAYYYLESPISRLLKRLTNSSSHSTVTVRG